MARPVKFSLDYFPLDVDIFDDEKIIPVSSEYGAQGDAVIIRILCSVYRNGYYAECTESFVYKIAKQTAVSHEIVNGVIQGLLKWKFFDKDIYDRFSVISSAGIQKRWLEATRKRVISTENLPFWVLEKDVKKELMAEETPTTQPEMQQKKRKEIKRNKKEIIKEKKELKISNEMEFVKPTVSEIEVYCQERNNGIDPQFFFDNNESKGWVVGKNRIPMKDWKAAIRTWEKNQKESGIQAQPIKKQKIAEEQKPEVILSKEDQDRIIQKAINDSYSEYLLNTESIADITDRAGVKSRYLNENGVKRKDESLIAFYQRMKMRNKQFIF